MTCFLFFSFLSGCIGIGAGTHGVIKSYRFSVRKTELHTNVYNLIRDSDGIYIDSVIDEYNDGVRYITMSVVWENNLYRYTFHFYGGKEYWDTSKTSAISLVYAYDEKGNGGSEGNGGVKWYDFKLKKELTEPFEQVFISKIDSVLEMKHIEE